MSIPVVDDGDYSCVSGCQVDNVRLRCGSRRSKVVRRVAKRRGHDDTVVSAEFQLQIVAQDVTGYII